MGRFRVVAAGLAMAAFAAACGGGGSSEVGSDDAAASPSTLVAAPATTAAVVTTAGGTTVPPNNLTLRITDVRLVNSEESDNGVRVLLPAGAATASVTLTGLPSPNRLISVCQASDLDRRLSAAACRMPANGDPVTVTLGSAASGVEIIQAGVSGPGPAGNTTTLDEVTIRYAASSREVSARLPQIAAGDTGGRPTFALTPAGTNGAYRAALTWSVIQVFGGTSSNAQVEVLQGGSPVNHAESGGLQVQLTGNVPAPVGDVAIRVQNIGAAAMVSPKVTLLLP